MRLKPLKASFWRTMLLLGAVQVSLAACATQRIPWAGGLFTLAQVSAFCFLLIDQFVARAMGL
jgi:hypothetical protein